MEKCNRAIFMAAGFGSRMVPVTINTPKPLVRVHGERIIDGLIDACLKSGIEEIIIVRGYLKEQFDQLLYKYPMIKFIDNPYFNEANNISSIYVAREYLENSYVFEADLLLSNPNIICTEHDGSDFLAIKADHTDDWCFESEDGYITEEKVGGENCYQMVGISYWSTDDGQKLSGDIEEIFATEEGKKLYWEQVPLKVKKDDYRVKIRECSFDDIVEIDTYRELSEIDDAYVIK